MDAAEYSLSDSAATEALGRRLAVCRQPGTLIFLEGDLGAGKTTLVRGYLRGLGHQGAVKSPTYTLVEPYDIDGLRLHHLDLYRVADPEELEWIGIRDLFDADSICLIEWPQRGAGMLPDPDLSIRLSIAGGGRRAELIPASPHGEAMIQCLSTTAEVSGT